MKILRSTLVAAISLSVASPTLLACAEKPGKKESKDDDDDKKKADDEADGKKNAKKNEE